MQPLSIRCFQLPVTAYLLYHFLRILSSPFQNFFQNLFRGPPALLSESLRAATALSLYHIASPLSSKIFPLFSSAVWWFSTIPPAVWKTQCRCIIYTVINMAIPSLCFDKMHTCICCTCLFLVQREQILDSPLFIYLVLCYNIGNCFQDFRPLQSK